MAHFLEPLLVSPDEPHVLKTDAGAVVATSIAGAFDSQSRRRGLLGRDSMPEGAALAIAPCQAIHTFFMRFAIDVVFVARNGAVVKVVPALGPWRIAGAWRAFAVIEMPAGAFERSGGRVGDRLVIT